LGLSQDFDFAKPTSLVRWALELAADPEALVLDFFAGSGTTAHAVMAQNAADGGMRRYILVQLPEPIDRKDFPTISAITRERVSRAGDALQAQPTLGSALDTGFRSYRLTRSNFKVWDTDSGAAGIEDRLEMFEEHVAQGATDASMLTELLFKAGYSLTVTIDAVDFAGVAGYSIDGGALLVCLVPKVTIEVFEAMAERDPAMIVVLDSCFGGNDEVKVNVLQTIRARNRRSGSDIKLRVV
jgi:adenine-specific DNA-methyltransferase